MLSVAEKEDVVLAARWRRVRQHTDRLAAALSDEDQCIQSMPDASPAKWHRAHTTWFFEQFVLGPNLPGYTPFDERFSYLFNSYYEQVGPRHARPQRGLLTRPSASEVGSTAPMWTRRWSACWSAARQRSWPISSNWACSTSSSTRSC
ncbi:formylglycine-generating enzyme family protein [Teichococcus aestuarii]|uniref:hypothetical protein n=1 Tax=Teichococcus aestuarii TaxID=568898 RepID=UPI003606F0CC